MVALKSFIPLLCAPLAVLGQNPVLELTSRLLGPITIPISSSEVSSIRLSLITFNDEVIDISNLSIFGNVNDGNVNCTATSNAGDPTIVGPASIPVEGARQITLSLINFNDEVIDLSNVSIFGDVNDAGCS